ncbi:MAG TPA: hypothetical protein ACFE0H_01720 [Elainellaceae cyanobacterium]
MSKSTQDIHSLFGRLFTNISPNDRATFTPQQIEAMRQAFAQVGWKKHPVDLRMSIPLPGHPGLYLVLLAGAEHRSKERIRSQQRLFWQSVGMISGTAILAILGWASVDRVLLQFFTTQELESYPTVLPWIETESKCTGESKTWRNGQCWDDDHDPMF